MNCLVGEMMIEKIRKIKKNIVVCYIITRRGGNRWQENNFRH